MPAPRNGIGLGTVQISIRPMGKTVGGTGAGGSAVKQPPSFKVPDTNWVFGTYQQMIATGYIKPYAQQVETYKEAQADGHIQTYAEAIRAGNIRPYAKALDNSSR